MKRIVVGLSLVAVGFLGGLLAQPPSGRPRFEPGEFMRRMPFASGTVASVQGNIITVRMNFGTEEITRQVTVTNQTQIQRSQQGTKTDIKANAFALVMGQPDPKSGWLRASRVVVMPTLPEVGAGAVGRIYDVKGGGEQFGISVPVAVNPNAQIFKLTPAKVSDIKPGEQVTARGRPDESGNLVAETVVIGETPFPGFGTPGGFSGGFRRGGSFSPRGGSPQR